tara:strand:- start:17 stop:313 length:297 start_codon:yes stop_codon:yes gene_type:complete
MADGVTIPAMIAELKLKYTKRLAWAAGNLCRHRWQEMTGTLPTKELRQKTTGEGSHCFAVYPNTFRPEMRRVLVSLQAADDEQLRLFDDPGESDEPIR